jgi:glycosyltransferase involved in cell wall biosynthesis
MLPIEEMRQGTWFVIAAYNEEPVIRSVVSGVRSKFPNVIVVDDGSSEGTGREAADVGALLITHPINLGQGAALQTGITYALHRNAKYIVTFDADGQHSVEDVDSMLDVMDTGNWDVVLGSRFCGTTENLPRIRRWILKAAIAFTRVSTGLKLSDTHNGLRLLKAEAARCIHLHQNGMAHASEFLEQIAEHHLSYTEVPVHIRYTEYSLRKGQKLSNSLNILMDLFIARLTR